MLNRREQDKRAEIEVGTVVPDDTWLDDPRTCRVKRAHLELLHLIPSQGRLILDAGCGPGTYGIILAEEGNDVVGIDISSEFIHRAKDRARRKALRFAPQIGDLERLPFRDNSFDICFCGWVLHHFPDFSPVVKELYRVLKPGGLLALAEPNESNTVMKLSRFVEDLPILRNWILRTGWDTPNRTVHRHDYYVKTLEQQMFADIRVNSCFSGGLPPLLTKPHKHGVDFVSMPLLHILFQVRRIVFVLSAKVLPRPLNGADLLITGIK